MEKIRARFLKALIDVGTVRSKVVRVKINRRDIVEICFYIREELDFDHLSCISAVDWRDHFENVYHFTRYADGAMLQLTAIIPKDDPRIESLCKIWNSANYHEREAYDLMGIHFDNHPNLKRILLPEDYKIHPLRKDFPQETERQYISRRKIRGGA